MEDTNEADALFYDALQTDVQGCFQKFICLSSAPEIVKEYDTTESAAVRSLFNGELNIESPLVRLNLAGLIGAKAGAERCVTEFAACPKDLGTLTQEIMAGEALFRAEQN